MKWSTGRGLLCLAAFDSTAILYCRCWMVADKLYSFWS